MFTDKTPALNVTSSHPGAWLDSGRGDKCAWVRGCRASGHRQSRPGDSASFPWECGVNQGSVRGEARLGRSTFHRRCLRGREGAEGWCQGQSLPTMSRGFSSPDACSALTPVVFYQCLPFPPPVKAVLWQFENGSGKKASIVQKFIEIIWKLLQRRNAYTSLPSLPKGRPLHTLVEKSVWAYHVLVIYCI